MANGVVYYSFIEHHCSLYLYLEQCYQFKFDWNELIENNINGRFEWYIISSYDTGINLVQIYNRRNRKNVKCGGIHLYLQWRHRSKMYIWFKSKMSLYH